VCKHALVQRFVNTLQVISASSTTMGAVRRACLCHMAKLTYHGLTKRCTRAPSKARLCQSGGGPDPGSLGQAPGTECCVVIGNAGGEAYTGSAWAAMRK